MRTVFVLFFVLLSAPNFAQLQKDNFVITDKLYYDFGEIFYHGLCDKDTSWLVSMLFDSVIAGEAYSDAMYCSKINVATWLCSRVNRLPQPNQVHLRVRDGEVSEKEIMYYFKKKILFAITICKNRLIITRLGVGKFLL